MYIGLLCSILVGTGQFVVYLIVMLTAHNRQHYWSTKREEGDPLEYTWLDETFSYCLTKATLTPRWPYRYKTLRPTGKFKTNTWKIQIIEVNVQWRNFAQYFSAMLWLVKEYTELRCTCKYAVLLYMIRVQRRQCNNQLYSVHKSLCFVSKVATVKAEEPALMPLVLLIAGCELHKSQVSTEL